MLSRAFLATCGALILLIPLTTFAADALAAPPDEIPVTGRAEPDLADFDHLMLSFMKEHDIPGGAMAIARHGKIVYARGFGYADVEKKLRVEPDALFRIASLSKPFTSAAILQLQERGKLRLDDPAFKLLDLTPHVEPGAAVDPRLWNITIRELLHHTGGFDRGASFDPMFRPVDIARATHVKPPAMQKQIIEFMMGQPLDFDPGTKMVYSNYGYCVLGRVIEKASGMSYEQYVKSHILAPLGIHRMRIGRTLEQDRAPGEVHYYPNGDRHAKSVYDDGRDMPIAYGGWCIEAMDSHGGWIASAPDLVRFASSFEDANHCPILKPESIEEMFRRPRDSKRAPDAKPTFYACGWQVRIVAPGQISAWHTGLLDGSATLMVRRHDGLTWAIVFNRDYDKEGKYLMSLMDPLVHPVADGIKRWPEGAAANIESR